MREKPCVGKSSPGVWAGSGACQDREGRPTPITTGKTKGRGGGLKCAVRWRSCRVSRGFCLAVGLTPSIYNLKVTCDYAQAVLDALVEGGVIAVFNFAPAQLTAPDSVKVQNVDLSALLKTLSCHIARTERPRSCTP
ncbi:protein of unknown function [Candidatus Methylomirabilis oxygeniifera]|uniref:Uncharacterized protein n=1 Tax=Methylomirabilis oxygeniifera TaxID=671143 RepID=D5MJ12_METO1|nr:protein of unknown function [Candidatus Methylomirabilis oxyfera]